MFIVAFMDPMVNLEGKRRVILCSCFRMGGLLSVIWVGFDLINEGFVITIFLSSNFEVSRVLMCVTSLRFHNCAIKNGFV